MFSQGDGVKLSPLCKYCGMNREKFGHSRMLIEYDDGLSVGTCSVHCAAVDLARNIGKTPLGFAPGAAEGTIELSACKPG